MMKIYNTTILEYTLSFGWWKFSQSFLRHDTMVWNFLFTLLNCKCRTTPNCQSSWVSSLDLHSNLGGKREDGAENARGRGKRVSLTLIIFETDW